MAASAAAAYPAHPNLSLRRRVIWVIVVSGALLAVACSSRAVVLSPPHGMQTLLGIFALLALAGAAQWQPLPLPLEASRRFSVVSVPLICAAVLYGAAVASLIAAVVSASFELKLRRTFNDLLVKGLYNTAVWALMAGSAGAVAHFRHQGDLDLVAVVAAAAAALFVTNIGLVALIVGEARLRGMLAFARELAGLIALPFALSISIVPLVAVVWPRHPGLTLLAVGPLVLVALYMRYQEAARSQAVLALTDPLTGLANRRAFEHRLQRALDRAEESREPVSVCFLDLNGFKAVNDTYGHHGGDQALVEVAKVLRQDGEAFRYAGDEFVLLLDGYNHAEADEVAAAVRDRVRAAESAYGPLSITIGVATYPDDGMRRNELVRAADRAFYRGKRLVPTRRL